MHDMCLCRKHAINQFSSNAKHTCGHCCMAAGHVSKHSQRHQMPGYETNGQVFIYMQQSNHAAIVGKMEMGWSWSCAHILACCWSVGLYVLCDLSVGYIVAFQSPATSI